MRIESRAQLVGSPWLAAVHLDVQRLPERVVLPLTGWVGVAAVTATAVTLDGALLFRAVIGGMVCLAGFGALRISAVGITGSVTSSYPHFSAPARAR